MGTCLHHRWLALDTCYEIVFFYGHLGAMSRCSGKWQSGTHCDIVLYGLVWQQQEDSGLHALEHAHPGGTIDSTLTWS